MNILFLNTNESDYSQDILFAGLRRRKDISLYEFPFNKQYHLPLKKYPRNLGYEFNGLIKSFFQTVPWSTIDVVVLAACKPKVLRTYLEVLPKLRSSIQLVFVDGGDWDDVGGDFSRLREETLYNDVLQKHPFDLIFKREVLKEKQYPNNVIPFPFGINIQRMPKQRPHDKLYDVSFWAVESNPIRTTVLKLLEDKFDCRTNGTVPNQKFHTYKRKGMRYLEELASCKIVLNFRGAGWDTLRYWEVPALGTFLISQEPQIEIPNNFRNDLEIVYCSDDLSDLIDLCEYYLRHGDKREQIAKNGEKLLKEFHSETARAEYFLHHIAK